MFEALADVTFSPPAIVQPAKKGGRSRAARQPIPEPGQKPRRAWPYIAGAIILLSDGTPCTVWEDTNGQIWCEPRTTPHQASRRLAP